MKIIRPFNRHRAFTMVELCVVMAALGFFALLALFVLLRPGHDFKTRKARLQCINNLKQISLNFDVWAGDHGGRFPMELSQTNGGTLEFISGPNAFRHFQVISNELSTPKVLVCPADEARPVAATSFASLNNSNLSYFISLDLAQPDPQLIWSGDRNLTNGTHIEDGVLEFTSEHPAGWTATIHRKEGNILLGDGSVQQMNETSLRNETQTTRDFTNRLQMPILGP
jgi:prepilin-type N-terminal cleavage/methylation domain-containing protein